MQNRELIARILDRAASDSSFRDRLVENPDEALRAEGMLPEIDMGRAGSEECDDPTCYLSTCGTLTCDYTCDNRTCGLNYTA